eukprot:2938055-Rhodomonas_salina.2
MDLIQAAAAAMAREEELMLMFLQHWVLPPRYAPTPSLCYQSAKILPPRYAKSAMLLRPHYATSPR